MPRRFPDEINYSDCAILLIPCAAIPIVAGKIGELEQRGQWETEDDWRQGYQLAAELQECIMRCGGILKDMAVMLAKAHSLDYTEALEAPMPALAGALYDAEQADTTGAMDAIYRHGAGEQAVEQSSNDNTCALVGWLAMLLSDGAITPAVASTACTVLKAGGQAALDLLGEANERGIGNNATLALRGSGDDPPTNLLAVVDELEAMLGYEETP